MKSIMKKDINDTDLVDFSSEPFDHEYTTVKLLTNINADYTSLSFKRDPNKHTHLSIMPKPATHSSFDILKFSLCQSTMNRYHSGLIGGDMSFAPTQGSFRRIANYCGNPAV
ncbi:hypothetical protein CDAR_102201 [Caerostris darwini]|uniref:Uncharacterized protein n=1 Tax=Caerostris darwini TaxID=1538125 RepID=A0AAV4RPD7_9ARAC|nr:hypothetical protein CDAR_102201 [Caerostris darwini]